MSPHFTQNTFADSLPCLLRNQYTCSRSGCELSVIHAIDYIQPPTSRPASVKSPTLTISVVDHDGAAPPPFLITPIPTDGSTSRFHTSFSWVTISLRLNEETPINNSNYRQPIRKSCCPRKGRARRLCTLRQRTKTAKPNRSMIRADLKLPILPADKLAPPRKSSMRSSSMNHPKAAILQGRTYRSQCGDRIKNERGDVDLFHRSKRRRTGSAIRQKGNHCHHSSITPWPKLDGQKSGGSVDSRNRRIDCQI